PGRPSGCGASGGEAGVAARSAAVADRDLGLLADQWRPGQRPRAYRQARDPGAETRVRMVRAGSRRLGRLARLLPGGSGERTDAPRKGDGGVRGPRGRGEGVAVLA